MYVLEDKEETKIERSREDGHQLSAMLPGMMHPCSTNVNPTYTYTTTLVSVHTKNQAMEQARFWRTP